MSRKVYYGGDWVTIAAPPDNNMAGLTLVPIRDTDSVNQTSTVVNTSTSANTKGAWTPLIASTSATANLIMLWVLGTGASANLGGALADVAIGDVGFEVPIVSNIAIPYAAAPSQSPALELPVNVPAGSRISFRWQSARASALGATVYINLYDFLEDVTSPTSLTTMGANEAGSVGTSLGTANATFVPIVSSTVEDYRSIILTMTNNDTTIPTNSFVTFDLGVGPAASEVLVPTAALWNVTTTETMISHTGGSIWIKRFIPAGSRLSVRFIDANFANNTGYSAVLLGVPL